MSWSLDKESYYSRWSEPILRRHAVCLTRTSEEDASSVRRSRSSSPLLTARQSTTTTTCCACRGFCDRNKSSKIRGADDYKKSKETRSKTQRIRESLELQLIGTQVEEALAGDRQSALIKHLDLATNTLEALIQHVQSLQVSHRAARRVLDFSHRLIIPYSASTDYCDSNCDLTNALCQAEISRKEKSRQLKNVMEICSKNVAASEKLQTIIDEHRLRRDDFSIAAKNFNNLLEKSKLSLSQMEKLQRQYETILIDYQKSRRALDAELPKIVKTRIAAIGDSFRMINEFYDDYEYNKETANLFKLIGENLCHDDSAVEQASCKESIHQPPEMCKKCKVNLVDKQ